MISKIQNTGRQKKSKDFQSAWGQFRLRRVPSRKNELLQAWDAADEYALDTIFNDSGLAGSRNFLVCNDAFGALAVALHKYQVESWSDSWLSHQAARNNYQLNGLSTAGLTITDSLTVPRQAPDAVILKVPKSLALLEYQLSVLGGIVSSDSRIIVAGMQKNLSSRVWQLTERYLGQTSTSLARKKARYISVEQVTGLTVTEPLQPGIYQLPETGFEIINHANVFSREKLDIGTRFFLQHFPVIEQAREIVDLGCGNGVLGLVAADKMPQARLHFIDESYMAVDSARQNFSSAFSGQRQAKFHLGDGLDGYDLKDADLVLCNPPFHHQHVVGDFIALRMFQQSKKILHADGELWVIGNRHLGYHKSLKRYFSKVETAASNSKFVLLKARH